jgi:ribosomal protein L12E/L44/L45/RPP1/RPP2
MLPREISERLEQSWSGKIFDAVGVNVDNYRITSFASIFSGTCIFTITEFHL